MRKATRRYFISFRLTAQERKQVQAFRRAGETVHQTARRLVLRASLPVTVATTGSVIPTPATVAAPGSLSEIAVTFLSKDQRP